MVVREIEDFISHIDNDEAFYDTMYQLYLLYNIRKGKIDADSGKLFPLKDVKARLANV